MSASSLALLDRMVDHALPSSIESMYDQHRTKILSMLLKCLAREMLGQASPSEQQTESVVSLWEYDLGVSLRCNPFVLPNTVWCKIIDFQNTHDKQQNVSYVNKMFKSLVSQPLCWTSITIKNKTLDALRPDRTHVECSMVRMPNLQFRIPMSNLRNISIQLSGKNMSDQHDCLSMVVNHCPSLRVLQLMDWTIGASTETNSSRALYAKLSSNLRHLEEFHISCVMHFDSHRQHRGPITGLPRRHRVMDVGPGRSTDRLATFLALIRPIESVRVVSVMNQCVSMLSVSKLLDAFPNTESLRLTSVSAKMGALNWIGSMFPHLKDLTIGILTSDRKRSRVRQLSLMRNSGHDLREEENEFDEYIVNALVRICRKVVTVRLIGQETFELRTKQTSPTSQQGASMVGWMEPRWNTYKQRSAYQVCDPWRLGNQVGACGLGSCRAVLSVKPVRVKICGRDFFAVDDMCGFADCVMLEKQSFVESPNVI